MTDNAVIVITEARLREMGLEGPAAPYLLLIAPLDAETPLDRAWFETLDALTAEVQRLSPRNLFTRTCGAEVDIDCDELIRLCRSRTLH